MSTAARHVDEDLVERAHRRLWELRDRAIASDPGLGRLRTALSATVCVGTALPVQLLVGSVLGYQGQTAFVATLFGAVVAMLGSNALAGPDRWGKVKVAAFFPVAVGIGLVGATLTDGQKAFQVVGFAVVLFGAVWVRRFGGSWFFYGFMTWMGFFFATFLQATWALVPELLVASVVSTAWVLALTTTIFRADPRRVLHTTIGAFFARGRAVARLSADLLELPAGDGDEGGAGRRAGRAPRSRRAQRRLTARQAGVAETALLADAWSADPRGVPPGWSPAALRRRLIESQQAVDRFAGAALALHLQSRSQLDADTVDPALVAQARRVLGDLAARRDTAALAGSRRLDRLADDAERSDSSGWWSSRHLAYGVREFLRFDAAAEDPPQVDAGEAGFAATADLVFGSLPGAPAVARDVQARGGRWNPLTRVSLTTRQAVQVTLAGVLAIGLGTLLSPSRYYWAVIAVFVTFTGTGTRSETFLKGAARIGGTVLGIVGAVALAHVTQGHTWAVITAILISIFLAFYLIKVSHAAMTFFITVLLGQMYTVLGTFSDQLLELRLGETAVGALAGVAVALVFAPLSTRDTARSARDELLGALVGLLEGAASYAEGNRVDLDGLTRALDDRARRLLLVARPLAGPLFLGSSGSRTRWRLSLFGAAVSQARALALDLQQRPSPETDEDRPMSHSVAAASRWLAEAARRMVGMRLGDCAPEVVEPLTPSDRALFGARAAAHDADPVVRHLHHLSATLGQLAEATVSGASADPGRHRGRPGGTRLASGG